VFAGPIRLGLPHLIEENTLSALSMSRRSFTHGRARRPVARVMALLTLLAGSGAFVLAGATAAHAAITDPFSSVFTANTNGNIQIRGNTVVTCQAPTLATSCAGAQANTNTPAANNNNNAFFMTYVNVDTAGGTGIFDSSSATVAVPSGGSVLFAALVWGGNTAAGPSLASAAFGTGTGTAADAASAGQVQLKVPGSSTYSTVTSTRTSFLSGATGNYQGYANVTAAVQAAGNGSYTVGNVQTGTGTNIQGGWSLVVAYSNPTDPPRNLTIFAGFGSVAATNVVDIPLSGFQTPTTGAVNTTLGAVSYEGDAGSTGDQMQLGDSTSTLSNISDALHQPSNTFTSVISDLGVDNSTRNPDYLNQLGFDASTFNVNSFLTNGQTTADIRLTSGVGGETYYPGIVTFATDLYAPALSLTKSVAIVTKAAGNTQAGIAEAGDTLQYTIDSSNSGVDQSDATVLTDTAPTGTTYKAGSLTSGGTALTDATGDDIGNFNSGTKQITVDVGTGATSAAGGVVAPAASIAAVTFEVVVNPGLAGGSTITNTAGLNYIGHQTSIVFTGSSNTVSTPVPNSAPIANADSPTTPANAPVTVDVLANDTDANADALTITSTTVPAHGTDSVVAGKVLYTPTAGYVGTDSFSYTISDGHGGTSTATVTVTVTALPVVPTVVVPFAPAAPAAVNDTATTSFGQPVTINVLANDSSGTTGTAPTIVAGSITPPIDSSGTTRGTVNIAGGQLVFVPPAGFAGTVTFRYSVTSALGGTSTASVTVTVKALAVATGATTVTVAAGTGSVSVNPAAAVAGHGPLTLVSLTQPTSNAVVTVVNGTFVVTPAAGFVGTVTFSYVVVGADGTQDTVTVTARVLGEALTLPFTGMDVEWLGLVAAFLVVGGMAALWLGRRQA
jgi:fimbrial isopeptide formation D2 family protein